MTLSRFSHFQDGLSAVCACIALACLGFAPFYLIYVGRKLVFKSDELSERRKRSYGRLFEDYRLEKEPKALRFSAMFFFRRFVMICVLTLLQE